MTHVAALWLALLSALTLVPRTADSFGRAAVAPRHAYVAAVGDETRDPARVASARAVVAPERALRASGVVARPRASRANAPVPYCATEALSLARRSQASFQAGSTRALRDLGALSHAVAARGSVLPYFPTAPPGLA